MLDRYMTGDVNRISPEAPVPVLHVTSQRVVAGGAANVATKLDRVVGADIVKARGGRVDLTPGHSTSRLIEAAAPPA